MKKPILVMAAFALVILCGCENSKKDNVTLSFAAENVDTALGKMSAPDAVLIDTAKILITRIKLSGSGDSDSNEVEVGPVVVYLDLDGNVNTIAAANIPQGTYDRIKFEIHKPGQNESLPDGEFRTGPGGNERYSIIVKGTYNSTPFVYRSTNTMNQSININPPLVIADSVGVANATLVVNVFPWFKNGINDLDPSDTSAPNVSMIENNIRASFRAFRDRNRDGDDGN